jgi:hypothetical protein
MAKRRPRFKSAAPAHGAPAYAQSRAGRFRLDLQQVGHTARLSPI